MRAYVEGVLGRRARRVGVAVRDHAHRRRLGRRQHAVPRPRRLGLDGVSVDHRSGADGTPRTAEIGATWLAASVQRTRGEHRGQAAHAAATRSTRGTWSASRSRPTPATRGPRAAIERIGAHFEGIRRAHVLASDGGDPRQRVLLDRARRVARRAHGPRSSPRGAVAQLVAGGAPSATRMRSTTARSFSLVPFAAPATLFARSMSQARTSAASAIGSLAMAAAAGCSSASASSMTSSGDAPRSPFGGVPGVVALRLVGDGGDELGRGTVVARAGQRLRGRRGLLEQRDRAVLGHGDDGHGDVERRLAERRPLVVGEERSVGHGSGSLGPTTGPAGSGI